jgi:RHS repeat-associated protein
MADVRGWPVAVDGGVGIGAVWGHNLGDLRIDAVFGNGVTSSMVYDPNDRLTDLTHAMGAVPVHDVDYGYDAVGNRLFMRNSIFPNRSQQYKYDAHYRLTEFRRGTLDVANEIPDANRLVDAVLAGQRNWTLDSRGNWKQSSRRLHDQAITESREANDANEITQIDPDDVGPKLPVVPTYDGNGNMKLDPLAPNLGADVPDGQRYEYDTANRLSKVYRTNGEGAGDDELLLEIKYDALGMRVESLEYVDRETGVALAEPVRVWHIVQGPMPIEEYAVTDDGLGGVAITLLREFIWGAAFPEPVAMIDHTDAGDVAAAVGTPEVLHYLRDALGSVVALADAAGEVVERYEYDPYAQTTVLDGRAFYHDHDFDRVIDGDDFDHLMYCVNGNGQSPECIYHHDRNGDRVVDMVDLGIFQAFADYDEDGTPAPPMFSRLRSQAFDPDSDGHIDMFDFLGLQICTDETSAFCQLLYDEDGDGVVTDDDLAQFIAQADGPGASSRNSKPAGSRYGNPFMWTGQRFDTVTGLYHFAYRSYSPKLGRWLQRDPLGNFDGMNLYCYGYAAPSSFTDPLGLWNDLGLPAEYRAKKLAKMREEERIEYERELAANGVDQAKFVAGMAAAIPSGIWSGITGLAHAVLNPRETKDAVAELLKIIIYEDLGDVVSQFSPILANLLNNWDRLSSFEKGKLVGRLIGDYGSTIVTPAGILKTLNRLRYLKRIDLMRKALFHYTNELAAEAIRLERLLLAGARDPFGLVWASKLTPDEVFGAWGWLHRFMLGGRFDFSFTKWPFFRIKPPFTHFFEIADPSQFEKASWPKGSVFLQYKKKGCAEVK